MKKIILFFVFALVATLYFTFSPKERAEKVIGVVVPMEHQALNDIVRGLKETLSGTNTVVKVMNAQGDATLQKTIIQQLMRDRCDVIVPIGTAASQMTLSLAKECEVVCLAAEIEGQTACLKDQLSAEEALNFLHVAFPEIKKITLLYSSSEKIAAEIPKTIQAAAANGIEVQKLMVQSHSELYTAGNAIANDSQAIFVLKDHLVVSGIQTVVRQAEKLKIPVMTSDEGSIIGGGAFAIGVKEADIGRQGGQMIQKILDGAQERAPQTMEGPFPLFVNKEACLKQGVDVPALERAALKCGYPIELRGEPCS
jgi:putative ABC transport system substrate-binding protein